MVGERLYSVFRGLHFQYSLCRVVLMVAEPAKAHPHRRGLSVLALSSRFDGRGQLPSRARYGSFQYSLCRVVLMVTSCDGKMKSVVKPFSTRSVESF